MTKEREETIKLIRKINKAIIKKTDKKYSSYSLREYFRNYVSLSYNYIVYNSYYDYETLQDFNDNIFPKIESAKEVYKVYRDLFSVEKGFLKNKGICTTFSEMLIILLANEESGLVQNGIDFEVSKAVVYYQDAEYSHAVTMAQHKYYSDDKKYIYDPTNGLQTYSGGLNFPEKIGKYKRIPLSKFVKEENRKNGGLERIDMLTFKPDSIDGMLQTFSDLYDYRCAFLDDIEIDCGKYISISKNF